MQFLANENFPAVAVDALRSAGHDVLWIRTEAPGIDDREVLKRAVGDSRILLTFDKDFGELVFRSGATAPVGLVLFRVLPASPTEIAQIAVKVLGSRDDWAGHFAVVEKDRVRMTVLPSNGSRKS